MSDYIKKTDRLMKAARELMAYGVVAREDSDGSWSLRIGKKIRVCGGLDKALAEKFEAQFASAKELNLAILSDIISGCITARQDPVHG